VNYCRNCGHRIRQITNILNMVVWIHYSSGEIACPSKTIAEPKYNQEAAKGGAVLPETTTNLGRMQNVSSSGVPKVAPSSPPRKSLKMIKTEDIKKMNPWYKGDD